MKNGERPTDVYEMENDPATRNQRLAAVQVNHTKLVAAMREKGLTSAQLEASKQQTPLAVERKQENNRLPHCKSMRPRLVKRKRESVNEPQKSPPSLQ